MKYVALLRGINVGGNSLIKMADLKAAVEKCGFKNVSTFINSGNVIFESNDASKSIREKLEQNLALVFGFEIRTVIKTKDEIETVLNQAPAEWFKDVDLRKYLTFVIEPETTANVVKVVQPKEGVDSLQEGNGVLYMSTKLSGITKSAFSRLAAKPIYKNLTIRNYSTIQKIYDLMNR